MSADNRDRQKTHFLGMMLQDVVAVDIDDVTYDLERDFVPTSSGVLSGPCISSLLPIAHMQKKNENPLFDACQLFQFVII